MVSASASALQGNNNSRHLTRHLTSEKKIEELAQIKKKMRV